MFALVRLAVIGFVFLTIVYFIVRIYMRSLEAERLEKLWEEEGRPGTMDDFVDRGLARYERSLRRKLIWLVYVVPTLLVAVLIYVINFM